MLVLSRRKNDRIVINNGQIVITIVSVDCKNVRIGFEASADVQIDRSEVWDVKERNRVLRQKEGDSHERS